MTNVKQYDFDTIHDRRNTSAIKWMMRFNHNFEMIPIKDNDIPLWIADMDFPNPPEIQDGLKQRIDHGFFGYTAAPQELKAVITQRMSDLYNWNINPDWILFNPGMVMFLGIITRVVTNPGAGILMTPPVYGPFHSLPPHHGRFAQKVPLIRVDDDAHTFHYDIDFDALEAAITQQTELFYLCSPHNPIGKAFTQAELEKLADICLRHNIKIASDDIHSDLMLGNAQHIPIATLSPEIAHNTITMIAGTKTFNMAGLACSAAIIPDDDLRTKVQQYSFSSGYHVDTLAYEALLIGYRDCNEWLRQVLGYITENRDYVTDYICKQLPMLKTTVPSATYLQWIDCSALKLPEKYPNPTEFFAEEAGVIFSRGNFFSPHATDYVRMNLACPRSMLVEGLDRMKAAIESL